jgi:hypothetical protein
LQQGDVVVYDYNNSVYLPPIVGDLNHAALVIAPGMQSNGTYSGIPKSVPAAPYNDIVRVASRGFGDCGAGSPNIPYDEIITYALNGAVVHPKHIMGLKMSY